MFGRRKREAAAEAGREAERRALFEELAKRPETVCPFLGLATARAGYRPDVTGEHRCYAFGDPAPISDEQQRHVCLERGYSNCPRYLRGVLVIPSEELEALRRPQPPLPAPPKAPPAPVRQPRRGGRRRPALVIPIIVLLLAAGAAGGWYLLGGLPVPVLPHGTPIVSIPPASGTAQASASGTPVPTSIVVPSSGVLPTPGLNDVATGTYAVYVREGSFPVFRLDGSGNVIGQATATFSRVSAAPVARMVGSGGAIYWRTLIGQYTNLAYTKGKSGPFSIYEIYRTPSGEARFKKLPSSEL